jgi:DNA invertase Pin-like site-specific DNA recombinase
MAKYVFAKYIRLSLEDVKSDSLSIPNQRLLLDRHIDSLEMDDVEVLEFVDNGHTGTNFERPGVQELLELVRQSKVDCILVKDFSRFGRNSIETGYFIERVFPLFRTRFIAVSDGFDSNDYKEDTGGMEIAFKYLMHEYYSQDLSRKEKSAKYAKFKRGEYQSKVCPYGYRKGANGRMEIDEEAAAVIRLIFETARTMKEATDVVKVLHERKILPPGEYRKAKGIGFHDISRSIGIWQRSTILRFLADERYTGMYIIGKREVVEVGSTRNRMKDESEWVKIPNHHPAIVSKELYDEVQTKVRHFKCPKSAKEYTLRGKVFCGCCRHAMQLFPRKVKAFGCRYTKIDETAECNGLEIGEQELERLLYEVISKQANIVMNIGALDTSGAELRSEQQAEYEKQLGGLQEEKRTLYERFVLGEIDAATYKTEKAMFDTEISRFTKALGTLKSEAAILSAAKSSDDELRQIASTALDTDKLTRTLVDLLIEKVYIYPGNHVEIVWKAEDFITKKGEYHHVKKQAG